MTFWRKAVLFYLGGCVYVALELLFRGRSHGSMFLAGGLCLVLIGQLNRALPGLSPLSRAVAGAGIITLVELSFGLLVNRDYAVWDYRSMPGNFLGQICPGFFLLWIPVAAMAGVLHDLLDKIIRGSIAAPGD